LYGTPNTNKAMQNFETEEQRRARLNRDTDDMMEMIKISESQTQTPLTGNSQQMQIKLHEAQADFEAGRIDEETYLFMRWLTTGAV